MALGFRDCCNQFSYFTLDTTPAFVSEFETYYIRTEQGINFCAVYVNLPTLNYSPPLYSVLEMTQQTNCASCIVSFPCPTQEVILVNEFVSGSVAQGTDCQIVTIPQMTVECQSTDPTTFNGEDGIVALVVSGGVAPYRFLIAGTESFLGFTQDENVYTVYDGVSAGTYSITVQDSNLDFSITVNCVLNNPSEDILIEPIVTPVSRFGASDGIIEFNITQGVPPYTIILNSQVVGTVIEDLTAGIYFFEISDQLTSQIITVEVTQPDPIVYPPGLCMSFNLCGTLFNLNFTRILGLENLRPRYRCTNPTRIGLKELYIRWGIGFPSGWVTTVENVQPDDIQFETFPGECNLNDVRFAAAGPLGEQPTGTWLGTIGFMTGIFPVVTPGGCPPTASVERIGEYCSGPPEVLAEVEVRGYGGAGGPYVYLYSSNGVDYTESSTNILLLINGVYSLRVRDSEGELSLPINFTVPVLNYSYSLNDVNFCTFLEPETVGLEGVLDRPVADGEFRGIDATISYFWDFSNIPEGLAFTGKFNVRFALDMFAGDVGYTSPLTSQEFLFDLIDAYIIQNGVVTNIKNTFTPTNLFLVPTPLDYEGSSTLYTPNYGLFERQYYTDNCTASTVNPTRSSPNYWYNCEQLYTIGSLIEGDERGANFSNFSSVRTNTISFNADTKLSIKVRFKNRNYMPAYIPEILNETDISTLAPEFHDPLYASILNTPNVDMFYLGTTTQVSVAFTCVEKTILQKPPSIPCFKFSTNSQIGAVPGGGNLTPTTFRIITSTPAFPPNDSAAQEVSSYQTFVQRNNFCGSKPSWAL